MKEFFSKIWAWVLKNKVVSIVIASVFVVGLTCAIVLPIALRHKHDFGTALQSNATHHWLECECGEKDMEEHEAKATYSHNDTHHWKDCVECGYDLGYAEHTYDQEVAETAYLHTEATATTKGIYYKSCVCGVKGTETFELEKIAPTLTLTVDSKVYDGQQIAPTYNTNSDAEIVVLYYQWDATANSGAGDWKLLSATIPQNVGQYKVRVAVRETATYQYKEIEEEFEITKKVLTGTFNQNTIYGQTTGSGVNTMYDFALGTEYGIVEGDEAYVRVFYNEENVDATIRTSLVVVKTGSNRLTATNYDYSGLTVTSTIEAKEITIEHEFTLVTGQTEYEYTLTETDGAVNGETVVLKVVFDSAVAGAGIVSKTLYVGGEEATNYVLSLDTTLWLISE